MKKHIMPYHGGSPIISVPARILLVLLMGMAGLFTAHDVNASLVDEPALALKYLEHTTKKNGQVTQAFILDFNGRKPDYLAVYYQVNQDPALYEASVKNMRVSVSSDSPAIFHLIAYAGSENRRYTASTDFCLFGKSGTPVTRQPAQRVEEDLPLIKLLAPTYNYWPQTGQEYRFKLVADFSPETVTAGVREENRVKQLVPDETLRFSHVPEHDKRLRKEGVHASKEETVIVRMRHGDGICILTYTLLLHRSRTGFMNCLAGGGVFLGSTLFFLGWVILKRKRSKAPW